MRRHILPSLLLRAPSSMKRNTYIRCSFLKKGIHLRSSNYPIICSQIYIYIYTHVYTDTFARTQLYCYGDFVAACWSVVPNPVSIERFIISFAIRYWTHRGWKRHDGNVLNVYWIIWLLHKTEQWYDTAGCLSTSIWFSRNHFHVWHI